jgi:hypothetical protein
MDLASAIVNVKAAEAASHVQLAVAARMLKMANDQGDAVLKLVQAAAENMEAASADVAQATVDLTAGVDVYA